jgi:hypothetical protein
MILLPGMVQGQYSNKVWCFGENAGVIFSNPVSYFTTNESSVSASVSIANSQDSLLFYGTSAHPTAYNNGWGKNGQLRNKNHLVMQNGDSLICLGCDFQPFSFNLGTGLGLTSASLTTPITS